MAKHGSTWYSERDLPDNMRRMIEEADGTPLDFSRKGEDSGTRLPRSDIDHRKIEEQRSAQFLADMAAKPPGEPEPPRDPVSRDLSEALMLAESFEEYQRGDDYLIPEGWDIRDTIHAVVTLARAYRGKLARKIAAGESTEGMKPAPRPVALNAQADEPAQEPTPALKLPPPPVERPRIIIQDSPRICARPPEPEKQKRGFLL